MPSRHRGVGDGALHLLQTRREVLALERTGLKDSKLSDHIFLKPFGAFWGSDVQGGRLLGIPQPAVLHRGQLAASHFREPPRG